MSVKIPIEADLGGVDSALAALTDRSKQLKAALGGAIDVPVQTAKAEEGLKALTAAAHSLSAALAKVAGTKVDVDVGTLADAMQQAQGSIAETEKRLEALGDTKLKLDVSEAKSSLLDVAKTASETLAKPSKKSALGAAAGEAKNLQATLERARKATADWLGAKTGRAVTPYEADRVHQTFLRRAARDPMVHGFGNIAEYDAGVADRYSSAADAEHSKQQTLARMAAASGISLPGAPAAAHGERHSFERTRAGAGMVGAGIGGLVGGVTSSSEGLFGAGGGLLGAGVGAAAGMMGGPAGAVIGGVVGGLASGALGRLGSSLDEALTEALHKGVEVSDLRRAMGEQASSYQELSHATMAAALGMGLTSAESVKLSKAFTRDANLYGRKEAAGLGEEMRSMFGFANAFGMPFQRSSQFFGAMRGGGITSDDRSSRQLAVAIADAMGRGAMFAQSEQVLATVQQFAQQAQQSAFRAPDVERFVSMLGTGVGMRVPGLDVANTGRVLAAADQSFRGGGSAGFASQSMIASSLMRAHGIDWFQEQELQSGGMFGTPESAFGQKSILRRQAEARRDIARDKGDTEEAARWEAEIAKMERAVGGRTKGMASGALVLEEMRRNFPEPAHFKEAMGRLYGQSPDQAAALDLASIKDPGLLKLQDRLKSAGVETGGMDMGALANMAQIVHGGPEGRQAAMKQLEAGKEVRPLSKSDSDALKAVQKDVAAGVSGAEDRLTNLLLKLYESRGRGETEADKSLALQSDIKSKLLEFADGMLPMTRDIKEGIFTLVEKIAPDSAMGKTIRAEHDLTSRIERPEEIEKLLNRMAPDDPQRRVIEAELQAAKRDAAAAKDALARRRDPLVSDEARRFQKEALEFGPPAPGPEDVKPPGSASISTRPSLTSIAAQNRAAEEAPYKAIVDAGVAAGFRPTSTTGGAHNAGSLHGAGRAVDFSTKDKTDDEIAALVADMESRGFSVRDERSKPAGQRVWSGPHIHVADTRAAEPRRELPSLPAALFGQRPTSREEPWIMPDPTQTQPVQMPAGAAATGDSGGSAGPGGGRIKVSIDAVVKDMLGRPTDAIAINQIDAFYQPLTKGDGGASIR